MANKRYYWLRLKTDFFKAKEMKKLRKIAGGDTFTIIYLKLMLLSVQDDGKLFFDGVEDTFAEELALEIDEEVEDVKITVGYLLRTGLMVEISGTEAALTQVPELIGSESESAERVRNHRARKRLEEEQQALPCNGEALQSNEPVTNCNTEIEKEKKKEIEIETKRASGDAGRIPYQEIVDLYNSICVSLPQVQKITDARKKAINARYKEYGLDGLKELYEAAEASDWLAGRKGDWSADFNWLMNPNNAVKVLEGNYKNKKGGKGNAGYQSNNGRSDADYYSPDFRQA